jgi:hypothetical protein
MKCKTLLQPFLSTRCLSFGNGGSKYGSFDGRVASDSVILCVGLRTLEFVPDVVDDIVGSADGDIDAWLAELRDAGSPCIDVVEPA